MQIPPPIRGLVKAGATVAGAVVGLSLASSLSLKVLQSALLSKRRKYAKPCLICKEKGHYLCKLCKGNTTIQWSPLYDPIAINPCKCPTCDGHGIQRCLNCLGKGYF